MEKIRNNVNTTFYLRYTNNFRLRNIEDSSLMVYADTVENGSPLVSLPARGCALVEEKGKRRVWSFGKSHART